MHSFLAFVFLFVLAFSQAYSSPAGSKSKTKAEVAPQTEPVKKITKFKESSNATTSKEKQSSSTSTQQHFIPFARSSKRESNRRYKAQFTNEAIERMSKQLKGKQLTDYLERARKHRSIRQASSDKARKKRLLKQKDVELAKSLEAEEAAKEKKEQLAAANKAALNQI